MAGIIQAAKWMENGKNVRRPYFVDGKAIFGRNGIVYGSIGSSVEESQWAEFSISDLLANDWEIVEESK